MKKILGKMKRQYYLAKAEGDYAEINRIARKNFSWVAEYLFDFLSHHKSRMLQATNNRKRFRDYIDNVACKVKRSKKKTYSKAQVVAMFKEVDEEVVNCFRHNEKEKDFVHDHRWPYCHCP